jgi:hypothetical protein
MRGMSDLKVSLEGFQSAYKDLYHVVTHYPLDLRIEPGACGIWSPREILAHLSGWLVEAEARYRLYEKEPEPAPKRYDYDTFNAESVEARADLTWDETLNELRANHATLLAHLDRVMARTAEPYRGYAGWLDALARDCREHTDQLRAFARKDTA